MKAPFPLFVAPLALLALFPHAAWAQDPAPSKQASSTRLSAGRPRIGLALSGGGARGLAEIGVLKELQRLHIPIDYVAGTSMGAIVGGLYATGMTTEEMEQALPTLDWGENFTDRPPRRLLPYRRKQDDRRYLSDFNAGVTNKRVRVASGMTSGYKFVATLNAMAPAAAISQSFDDLPIPFRCVATDLETGEEVVLAQGPLSQAIRASASLPAIFSPVEMEGRLLVDGGLANNLPVDVVRAMGADIVIAVDVGTSPTKRDSLNSAIGVMSKVVSMLSQRKVNEQAARADILIRPDLKSYSALDFAHTGLLVDMGEAAARENSVALAALSLPEVEYEEHRRALRGRRSEPAALQFVEFEGTTQADERLIRRALQTVSGVPLEVQKIQTALLSLYNTGNYNSVTYQLVEKEGNAGVRIKATPNPFGPIHLRFGLRFSTDFEHHSDWGVLAGLRWSQINARGGEWKTDADMGLNSNFATEFYQPLAYGSRWFIAPGIGFSSELQDRFVGDWDIASYRATKTVARLDFGTQLGQYGEIRLGPLWGHAWYRHSVGDALMPRLSQSIAGMNLQATVDRLDSADLPSRGYLLTASAFFSLTEMGARSSYKKAELKWSGFLPVGSDTLFASLSFGSGFGSDVPPYDWYRLGGMDSFAGYQPGQLVGPYYAIARLGYMRRLADWPTLIGRGVYIVLLADGGNAGLTADELDVSALRYSGTIALGTSTRFGIMYLGLSQAKGGILQATLSLGKRF